MLFLLSIVPLLGTFAIGLSVGWLLAKGRRDQALAAFVIGAIILLWVDAAMFSTLHVFSIQTKIK